MYACEKFSNYVLGKPVLLETDHKPLYSAPFGKQKFGHFATMGPLILYTPHEISIFNQSRSREDPLHGRYPFKGTFRCISYR